MSRGLDLAMRRHTSSTGAPLGVPPKLARAIAAHQAGDYSQARRLFRAVLEGEPKNIAALHHLAVLEAQQGNLQHAAHLFDRATLVGGGIADIWADKGKVLTELGRLADAIASYQRAIDLNPGHWIAQHNLGCTLLQMKRPAEALAAFDAVAQRAGNFAPCFKNRGIALKDLGRPEEAIASYRQAIALTPDDVEAWINLGQCLARQRQFAEAFAAYDRAMALKPDFVGVAGWRLRAKLNICDWRDLAADEARIADLLESNVACIDPISFFGVSDRPALQLRAAELWTAAEFPAAPVPVWNGAIYRHDRLRVAYVSADFREHPVSYLAAGMFEHHDRSAFDISAIAIGGRDQSAMRTRLCAAFDRFLDAAALDDQSIAAWIREQEIDILIDLTGFTADARTGVFARRCAPIQASYLGYPGTMGAGYIDYLIADGTLIPAADRRFYKEKIVALPHSYQANDRARPIAATTPSRVDAGLPAEGFVFSCFNNAHKLLPPTFDAWMRILGRVPDSVIWLFEDNAFMAPALREAAAARAVDPARLVFAKRLPLAEHLARLRLADLVLDTLPYNAHTTASDALWAGVPVVTRIGATFAGRVGASLLTAIGLPDLITETPDDYERLAVDLATDPDRLAGIRDRLARQRLTAPLFDTALFTRHIERAYRAMHERHRRALPPDHIAVLA